MIPKICWSRSLLINFLIFFSINKDIKKGQILINKDIIDYFYSDKIITKNSHGTGCALSSALACGLGQKMDLNTAVKRAHTFVNKSIKYAPNIGKGNGPLNHLINNIKN